MAINENGKASFVLFFVVSEQSTLLSTPASDRALFGYHESCLYHVNMQ
jgi:hypothetical protein